MRQLLERVAEDVSGGYSLAQSFSNAGTLLPVTFIETVRAGEQSGTLGCASSVSTLRQIRQDPRQAGQHPDLPVLVLIVAAIVFLIIMVVAVPHVHLRLRGDGSELPAVTTASWPCPGSSSTTGGHSSSSCW